MNNWEIINPKVSMIVPAYNVQNYIEKCINSLLNQTYTNIEIIIIDDGSTDNTSQIVDSIVDPRVMIIHQDNQGLVVARKNGINCATGEYIGFVDGDDFVKPSFVKKLVDIILSSKSDFVHEGYCEFNNGIIKKCGGNFDGEYEFDSDQSRIEFLNEYVFSFKNENSISNSIWSKLFKREFIKKSYSMVPDYQSYGEDLISLIYCIMNCNKFAVLSCNDYVYRVLSSSMSHLDSKNSFYKEMELCNEIKKLSIVKENAILEDKVYDFVRIKLNNALDKSSKYYYPDISEILNKNIVIYGAGRVGRDYYVQLKDICKSITIVDRNYSNINDINVVSPNEVSNLLADYFIIAVEKKELSHEIKRVLLESNISENKIIWVPPKKVI